MGATGYFVAPVLESLLIADMSMGMTGTKEHEYSGRFLPFECTRGDLSIAEDWEFLQDPLRLVLHIRPGIYWPDKPGVMESRELTADDVVFSIQRHWDSPRAGQEWSAFLKSVTATDRYTVVCELNFYFPDFGYWFMWGQETYIIAPEWAEAGAEDWNNLVGTGPFMLANWVSGSVLEYVKNPIYRGRTIIDGKEYQIPFVDKLVYPFMAEDAVRLAALRTGKIDIWEDVAWVYEDTLADTNPELRSWFKPPFGMYRIGIRQDIGPPFDILEVRRAMNMAIDKQAIIDKLYGGNSVMLNYPIAADMGEAVYTPLEKLPKAARELFEYNLEEAERLMAEAGYTDGFDAEVIFSDVPKEVEIMSMVKDYWADIGINLELVALDKAAAWAIILGDKDHKHMAALFDSSPGPAADLVNSWRPGGIVNISWTDDPIFNDIMSRWDEAIDLDESNALIKQANVHIIEQTYDIFIPEAGAFVYAWPWIKHYEGEKMTCYLGSVGAHAIAWIDQDLKAEMGY
jgi:peptide/nickel transport system substrate-binding protein